MPILAIRVHIPEALFLVPLRLPLQFSTGVPAACRCLADISKPRQAASQRFTGILLLA